MTVTRTIKPSLVPQVLDALVALANANVDAKFPVIDAVHRRVDELRQYVAIGWTGRPNTRSVAWETPEAGVANHLEPIEVQCHALAVSGDDGQKGTRDALFDGVINPLARALAEDPTLGGLVHRARIKDGALEPATSAGAGTTALFTIRTEGVR